MASADFTNVMEALDENTQVIIQAELERLALLGEEREKVAKQQIQEEILKKSERVIKKPATYEVGEDIKSYVNSWKIYKKLLNLSDDVACLSFITYLNPVTQNRLKVLGLLEERNWEVSEVEEVAILAVDMKQNEPSRSGESKLEENDQMSSLLQNS
ncbi:hypothetical protein ACHWQZ_G002862 [Mnemiopsis leidyi]